MTQKDTRIGYLLKRAQQALRNKMDSQLKEIGISTPQYSVLATLERLGDLSNAKLAEECFVTPQTMIRIVKSMTEIGLIQKSEHPTHGKIINIVLSRKGKNLVKKAQIIVNNIEASMLKNVHPNDQEEIRNFLEQISQNLLL